MPAEDALLVIDANKYLDLYRTVSGKKLVASLVEQAAHIFVTRQIVEEVQRNKIEVVKTFLSKQFGELEFPRKSGHGVKLYSACSYSAGDTYPREECRRWVL